MKLEIIKVEHKEYEEIETNEPMKYYRRMGPDHWEHKLGTKGWHRLINPSLYEETYQIWKRKEQKNIQGQNKNT